MLPKPLVAASLKPIMLSLLAEGDMYGYQIIHRVQELSGGQIQWATSKLYPLLHRLEHEALVEAYWQPSESGPKRKYYRLTPQGLKALEASKRDWKVIHAILTQLWGPDVSGWVVAPG